MTTYQWADADKGGDWNNPQNWEEQGQLPPGGPPGAGDDVIINLHVVATITTDGASVASLIDASHTILVGNLDVAGELSQAVVSGGAVTAGQFDFSTFNGTTLSAGSVSGGSTLNSGTVTAGELIWANIKGGTVSATNIDADANHTVAVSAGTVNAQTLGLFDAFATLGVGGGTVTIHGAAQADGGVGGPAEILVSGGRLDLLGGLVLDGGARMNDGSILPGTTAGGVISASEITVGDTGSGAVFVGGSNAHLRVTSDLILGKGGDGSLTVANGGRLLVVGNVQAAVNSGSTATATISDPAAELTFERDWQIGLAGSATWTLSGAVSATVSGQTELGVSSGGSGGLTLSDAGTSVVAGGGVIVGGEGQGAIIVQSGALFDGSAGKLTLGESQGAKGAVQVNDSGSKLIVGDDVTIGALGGGTVSITGGAATMSANLTLGESQGAAGNLTVNGGKLTLAGDITIGDAGKGTVIVGPKGSIAPGGLTIPNGATNTITIAEQLTGKGTLTVDGSGASVTSFGLIVGGAGVGALKVADHGKLVTTGDATVADKVTANIQKVSIAAGGSWTVGGNLLLGDAAIATAQVAGGSTVLVEGDLVLGETSAGAGTLTLSGSATSGGGTTPSRLRWGGVLDVGQAGTGALAISAGAKATFIAGKAGAVEIGATAGSTGKITVTGASSELSGKTLAVGGDLSAAGGAGALTVGAGAVAEFVQRSVIWGGGKVTALTGGAITLATTLDDGQLNAAGGAVTVNGGFTGAGKVLISGGGGFTLDASKTTKANRVQLQNTNGSFSLAGGSAGDVFKMTVGSLSAQDAIIGGAGSDTLAFTTAGTVASNAFSHVSGIDQISLAAGGNTLAVGQSLLGRTDGHKLTIVGGAGADKVVASGVTGGTLVFNGGGGADSIVGGKADNVYQVDKATGTLAITNGFSGGAAAHGSLQFGAGLSDEGLWFERSGSNLVIDVIGTKQQVTLAGWFGSNKSAQVSQVDAGGLRLDTAVASLVSAMATYSTQHPSFDPTAAGATMPNDPTLQNAIAASWHH